jgi:hypothetical protein
LTLNLSSVTSETRLAYQKTQNRKYQGKKAKDDFPWPLNKDAGYTKSTILII